MRKQMTEALKNKNSSEATIASRLLEVAKKKMHNAMEKAKECSDKREKLDSARKRLKQMYSKKRKT